MGRGVALPRGCVSAVYYDVLECSYDEWDDFVDGLREQLIAVMPSLHPIDEYLEDECRIIAHNDHACFGISEYCGVASLWITCKEYPDHPELASAWCDRVRPKFEERFGGLARLGTMSNGCSVYKQR